MPNVPDPHDVASEALISVVVLAMLTSAGRRTLAIDSSCLMRKTSHGGLGSARDHLIP